MPNPRPQTLKDGSVVYRVQYRLTPGGVPTSDRFETYEQAAEFCRLIERVGGAGARRIRDAVTADVEAAQATCAVAFDEYLEHVATYSEANTLTRYRKNWDLHIGPKFDVWPVSQVRRELVEEWVRELRVTRARRAPRAGAERGFLSAKTIKNVHGLLSSVLDWQVKCGRLAGNPAKGVRLPRSEVKRPPVFLSEGQRLDLLMVLGEPWRLLVEFLLSTGLRWSEATALRPCDFMLEQSPGVVRVERAWKKIPGGWEIGAPKTKKGRRTVSIPDDLCRRLEDRLNGLDANVLVFEGPRGGHLRQSWFSEYVWLPAVREAGLWPSPAPRVHDLRHTHASMLLAKSVPLHVVQYRLGHESISTTADVYGHLMPEAGLIAAQATAEAMAPVGVLAG